MILGLLLCKDRVNSSSRILLIGVRKPMARLMEQIPITTSSASWALGLSPTSQCSDQAPCSWRLTTPKRSMLPVAGRNSPAVARTITLIRLSNPRPIRNWARERLSSWRCWIQHGSRCSVFVKIIDGGHGLEQGLHSCWATKKPPDGVACGFDKYGLN